MNELSRYEIEEFEPVAVGLMVTGPAIIGSGIVAGGALWWLGFPIAAAVVAAPLLVVGGFLSYVPYRYYRDRSLSDFQRTRRAPR